MSDSFYQRAKKYHSWTPSTKEARNIQLRLRDEIKTEKWINPPHLIAGADVAFDKENELAKAAVVILDFEDLSLVEEAVVQVAVNYPYIPGYLSFREAPSLLKALDKLDKLPDVILCDSQGYAHPRRFGLACHLGILTDIPTIGVAKTKLIGKYEGLPPKKGSSVPLMDGREQVGLVVRTRTNVNPLFLSVGHKVDLQSAKSILMGALTRYKLPETTRKADTLASFQ